MGSLRKYQGKRGVTWGYVIDLPPEKPGERRQKMRRGFPTKKAATEAMNAELVERRRGSYIEPSTQPTGDYLREWLQRTASTRAPGTNISYRHQLERVIAHVGSVPLGRLTGLHLQRAYDEMGTRYAASTIRAGHTSVHAALEQAVKWELLLRNPADAVVLPAAPDGEVLIWTAEQTRTFLAGTVDHRDHALWRLVLDTHMRAGEALALQWEDVDLEAGTVHIHRTVALNAAGKHEPKNRTKTGTQRRLRIAPATVAALLTHRARQNARRLRAGELWHATGLVFDRGDGQATRHHVCRGRLAAACKKHGVPAIQLKALRHTGATIAVTHGVPLHTVSKRLGHSTIKLTADLYAHGTVEADEMAAEVMERLLSPTGGQIVSKSG